MPTFWDKPILVSSFDMDSCMFHQDYNWQLSYDDMEVINNNKSLLDLIKSKSPYYKQTIVLLGSARQTKQLDDFCSNKNTTESAFTAIQKIASYLNARLDRFLLADIYHDFEDGTSFNRAIDKNYSGLHAQGPNDYTKFTLLYAQIHKIANQYPKHQITFDFYDDGGSKPAEILWELNEIFSEMPDKLPRNVILNLIHYEGKDMRVINSVLGTGFIDVNYRQTVLAITRMSQKSSWYSKIPIIDKNSLRLDESVFIHRRSFDDAVTVARQNTFSSLNLRHFSITMMEAFWNLILSLFNYFRGAETPVSNDSGSSLSINRY